MSQDAPAPAAMPTHLIAIGFLGGMRCYLGISRAEAEARYLAETGEEDLQGLTVTEVPIVNGAFQAYEVWAS